jgi:hypothetical protein
MSKFRTYHDTAEKKKPTEERYPNGTRVMIGDIFLETIYTIVGYPVGNIIVRVIEKDGEAMCKVIDSNGGQGFIGEDAIGGIKKDWSKTKKLGNIYGAPVGFTGIYE